MKLIKNVDYLIQCFGGLSKTAEAVGKKPSTVLYWKKKGAIPMGSIKTILYVSQKMNLPITLEDLVFGKVLKQSPLNNKKKRG